LINSKTEQGCEKGKRSHSFGNNDFSNTLKENYCYVSYQLKLQQKNFQQNRMETDKCHPYFTLVTPSSHYELRNHYTEILIFSRLISFTYDKNRVQKNFVHTVPIAKLAT